jgi:KGK domain
LVQGAKAWQRGKVRIKVNLEFCPEECGETIPMSNETATNQIISPLDDIRKMLDGDNQ